MARVRIREPVVETPPPDTRRRRRVRANDPEPEPTGTDPLMTALAGGVSTHTLKQIFRLEYEAVRDRLRPLAPLRIGRGGGRMYDLGEAAEYLVDPKIDLVAYLKTVKTTELPQRLQAAWWDAKLKRQKWEKNAGDLWPTARVLERLVSAFKLFRVKTQLWLDEFDQHGLSPSVRELLTRRVDSLLADMYRELIDDAKKSQTFSQLADADEDAGAVEGEDDE